MHSPRARTERLLRSLEQTVVLPKLPAAVVIIVRLLRRRFDVGHGRALPDNGGERARVGIHAVRRAVEIAMDAVRGLEDVTRRGLRWT